ncbi:MAG: cation:proton antiporter [Rariglobus sp.]|nr:cation:proton antiporter [Rariglobus sp.]
MHDISLITTIAFGLTAALILGLVAKRFGLSPIVGYLLAGLVVGPHTPGFVGDAGLAKQLAEIGVILLMFGVGLHFHIGDLMAVRSIAVPGAIGQSLVATAFGLLVALAVGWEWNTGIVLGIAVSVASTVVLLRALMDHDQVETAEGRVAVGWLVVEDIITVLVLVILPALAVNTAVDGAPAGEGSGSLLWSAGVAVLKLVGFAAFMAIVGAKFVPWLLLRVAVLRSRELFTLTVLVTAMAIATLGYVVFGASMALGAFMAGMVVGHSKLSHQAAADALPMRDAFAVLFFVAVGMLFDWRLILEEPWLIAGLVAVTMIVKPAIALIIVIAGKRSLKTGIVVAAGLGQIGEFSFIVAETAKPLGIMPESGYGALVACAIISISLNPLLFRVLMRLEPWVRGKPALAAWLDRRTGARGEIANQKEVARSAHDGKTIEAIVVGYGPVGREVLRRVEEYQLTALVIDMNAETVLTLQAEHKHALFGDASRGELLLQAGIKKASYLIVTTPDPVSGQMIVSAARQLNPTLQILIRSRYLSQSTLLQESGADAVCCDEAEISTALAVLVRAHVKADGFKRVG